MNLGELNKGAVALILVLLLGAGGYLWYKQMYQPAVAAKAAAVSGETAAQGTLSQAKSKLAAAQAAIEEAKKENSAPDDSVARVQLARKAVPPEKLIDDAAIVLMDLARRADVRTSFKSGGEGADAAVAESGGDLNGATPVDVTFKAAGSYQEMMLFMRLVEDTVAVEDGKLYARDRLFNVVQLSIGGEDASEESSSGGFSEGGEQKDANTIVARRGEILFTVTVRMYTSSTENAQSVGALPDPAAGATDTDGTTGTNGATGTEGAGTDTSAGGTPPATGTDTSAGGAPLADGTASATTEGGGA